MDVTASLESFAALSQETRLEAFRMLVKQEPHGLPAGEIARRLKVPHNTMSSHLAILERAGLVSSSKHSRSVVYRAELAAVRALVVYLLRDCCNGNPDLCAPLIADISRCCQMEGAPCG